MGKIRKILETELVGGTQSTDVYPVTSTKAVYDENNVRLDTILTKKFDKASAIFTAMPLVLTDSLKKAEALEPTNITANYKT